MGFLFLGFVLWCLQRCSLCYNCLLLSWRISCSRLLSPMESLLGLSHFVSQTRRPRCGRIVIMILFVRYSLWLHALRVSLFDTQGSTQCWPYPLQTPSYQTPSVHAWDEEIPPGSPLQELWARFRCYQCVDLPCVYSGSYLKPAHPSGKIWDYVFNTVLPVWTLPSQGFPKPYLAGNADKFDGPRCLILIGYQFTMIIHPSVSYIPFVVMSSPIPSNVPVYDNNILFTAS